MRVVYGRTFSDIPYSKELAEIYHVDSLISDSYRKTNRLIAPYIEARFKALSNILEQSGIKNIIEIGMYRNRPLGFLPFCDYRSS